MDGHNPEPFLTKSDYEAQEQSHMSTMEIKEYRRAYQHAFNDFQNQMNLRNRTFPRVTKDTTDHASANGPKVAKTKSTAKAKGKGEMKDKPQPNVFDKKDIEEKEADKNISTFNLEQEISKIKVSVRFNELLKNIEYRK